MIGWKSTKNALAKLEDLLTCKICDNLFSDPCSLEACDHNFCRGCVENLVGIDSKCPECGAFAWVKDLKTNRQLVNTVNASVRLRSLVGLANGDKPDYSNDDGVRRKPVSGCSSDDFKIDVELDKNLPTPSFEKETTKNLDNVTGDVFAKSLKTYSRAGLRKAVEVDKTEPRAYDDVLVKLSSVHAVNLKKKDANSTPCDSESKPSKRKQANEKHFWKQAKKKIDWADGKLSVYQQIKQTIDENIQFQFNSRDEKENIDSDNLFTNLRPRPLGTCLDKTSTTTCKIGARHCDGAEKWASKTRAQKTTSHSTERSSEAIEYIEQNQAGAVGKQITSNGQKMKKTASDTRTPFKQGSKRKKNLDCIVKRSKSSPSASPILKRNKRGETLLHVASIKGHVDTVRTLLAGGADPNTKDHAGWTPLHEACNHGHVTIAELLLDHGAMIDIPGGFDHDVPLHDAVANGRVTIARLLVSRGASLDARNKQGLFPKDYAVTEEMQSVLSSSPSNSTKAPMAKNSQLLNERSLPMSPKVLLATGLNAEQKDNLHKCATVLNAYIVTEFSISVTHIVTTANERGVCPRTIKYLKGILTGKWIVDFDWISKCLRQKMWVAETLFEIKGTNDAMVEAPKRARINVLKQLPGLFDGCQFYFYGDFVPPHPSKNDLSQMISYSGGKVLSREPKPDVDNTHHQLRATDTGSPTVAYHARPESRQYRCTCYVVYDPLAEKNPHIWCTDEVCTVPSTWIMDCASNFTILDLPS